MIDVQAFISARTAAGLSQKQLGNRAGCSQQLVTNIENRTTLTSKFLPKFAAALNVPPEKLDPDWGAATTGLPASALNIPAPELMSLTRDFPIYTSAEGGPGEIIRSSEPVDWAPRPAPVASVRDAYGLNVVGESMFPEFEPGDVALVNPALPVIGNTTCIFYAEKDGEARATIKRLIRASADNWHVRQWNPLPGRDFTLSRKEWTICHRVLGKYYRH